MGASGDRPSLDFRGLAQPGQKRAFSRYHWASAGRRIFGGVPQPDQDH